MSYVNVGVIGISTKSALKAAVKANPSAVRFYGTSPMGPQFSGPATDIPEGTTLTVVGPDPYRSRKWFASVKRTAKGIVVS